jgi:hypothetical protein
VRYEAGGRPQVVEGLDIEPPVHDAVRDAPDGV